MDDNLPQKSLRGHMPLCAEASDTVDAYEAVHGVRPSYYATTALKLSAMMLEVEQATGAHTHAIVLGEVPVVVYEMLPHYDAKDETWH
jgi:hypothetical protein